MLTLWIMKRQTIPFGETAERTQSWFFRNRSWPITIIASFRRAKTRSPFSLSLPPKWESEARVRMQTVWKWQPQKRTKLGVKRDLVGYGANLSFSRAGIILYCLFDFQWVQLGYSLVLGITCLFALLMKVIGWGQQKRGDSGSVLPWWLLVNAVCYITTASIDPGLDEWAKLDLMNSGVTLRAIVNMLPHTARRPSIK